MTAAWVAVSTRARALVRRRVGLGSDSLAAASISEMAERLPSAARWALRDVDDAQQLWTAEQRWWKRMEEDGRALLTGSGFSMDPVLGAVAVLAADARRVRSALEIAARGGGDELT